MSFDVNNSFNVLKKNKGKNSNIDMTSHSKLNKTYNSSDAYSIMNFSNINGISNNINSTSNTVVYKKPINIDKIDDDNIVLENDQEIGIKEISDHHSRKTIDTIKNKNRLSYQSFSRTSFNFKIILIGDVSVGKTCIKNQLIYQQFNESYKSTVGVEFSLKNLKLNGYSNAEIQVWDTCGQERFKSLTRQYYRDAQGILIVFDITNKTSFSHVEDWLNEIYSNILNPSSVSFMLIGNKCDMNSNREVSVFEAKKMAEKNEMDYIEISAKTGENVLDTFETLSWKIIDKQEQELMVKPKIYATSDISNDKNISLRKLLNYEEKKNCC